MHLLHRWSWVIVALFVASCATESQQSGRSRLICTDCTIVLERIVQLSDVRDPGMLADRMLYATRMADGRILLPTRKADGLLVFDSTGTYLARVGSRGAGPGEFGRIRRVFVGAGDSLHVTDWGLGRLQLYSPSLQLIRTVALADQPTLVLRDGQYLVLTEGAAAGRGAEPVQLLRADATRGRAFGRDTVGDWARGPLLAARLAAESESGDVWLVAPGRYQLERWDPATGRRVMVLDIVSAWFPDLAVWPSDETIRPPAVIESIWEREGLVWVLVRVADLDWQAPAAANRERVVGAEEYDVTFDWIIEVIDPVAGRVVATRRFRNALWGRPNSPVLTSVSHAEQMDGPMLVDIWLPRLVPREVR